MVACHSRRSLHISFDMRGDYYAKMWMWKCKSAKFYILLGCGDNQMQNRWIFSKKNLNHSFTPSETSKDL